MAKVEKKALKKVMTVEDFVNYVKTPDSEGRYHIFGVEFTKADDSLRKMAASCGVSKGVKNDPGVNGSWNRENQDRQTQNLTCYDMNKIEKVGERGAFRRIPLTRIIKVKLDGTEYLYDNERKVLIMKD